VVTLSNRVLHRRECYPTVCGSKRICKIRKIESFLMTLVDIFDIPSTTNPQKLLYSDDSHRVVWTSTRDYSSGTYRKYSDRVKTVSAVMILRIFVGPSHSTGNVFGGTPPAFFLAVRCPHLTKPPRDLDELTGPVVSVKSKVRTEDSSLNKSEGWLSRLICWFDYQNQAF
jgi:hypothetical protein